MKDFLIYILKYTLLFGLCFWLLDEFDNLTTKQIMGLSTIIAIFMMFLQDIVTELRKINKNK